MRTLLLSLFLTRGTVVRNNNGNRDSHDGLRARGSQRIQLQAVHHVDEKYLGLLIKASLSTVYEQRMRSVHLSRVCLAGSDGPCAWPAGRASERTVDRPPARRASPTADRCVRATGGARSGRASLSTSECLERAALFVAPMSGKRPSCLCALRFKSYAGGVFGL